MATQIVNSSSFGIPYQANGTPIDKTDLLPDVSTLLLDDQANTTAIVFAENSGTFAHFCAKLWFCFEVHCLIKTNLKHCKHLVIARRLPVFRQLCSNEHTLDEDHHWLDDSVTTSLIWTLSSSASIDNSTNIWTALSTNSSFTAPLSNGSQPTSSNTSSTSLDHSLNWSVCTAPSTGSYHARTAHFTVVLFHFTAASFPAQSTCYHHHPYPYPHLHLHLHSWSQKTDVFCCHILSLSLLFSLPATTLKRNNGRSLTNCSTIRQGHSNSDSIVRSLRPLRHFSSSSTFEFSPLVLCTRSASIRSALFRSSPPYVRTSSHAALCRHFHRISFQLRIPINCAFPLFACPARLGPLHHHLFHDLFCCRSASPTFRHSHSTFFKYYTYKSTFVVTNSSYCNQFYYI